MLNSTQLVRTSSRIAFAILLAGTPGYAQTTNNTQHANIVLIVADDLGYGDLGCYGNANNKTPHIDALARRGVRFTDFQSAGAMCTPTRAAMLTGRYQQRFGRKFDGPLSGLENRDEGLPYEAITIAEVLKGAGYATACIGKWHLGYQPPWLPPSQGFDEFRGLGSGDGDFHTRINRWGREDWWHNNRIRMEPGYTTQLITKYGVEFIEKHREQPFFLYLPHLAIHFPWQGPEDPPQRVEGNDYSDDKWGIIPNPANVRPHVKSMVESLDDSVGEIMVTLKNCNLDSRTVVIFTSDNGGYLTYGENFQNISSNGPLRDQKGSVYEGGHRVPTIVAWPGKIRPRVTDATAHSTDLLPTLANLAGATIEDLALDGLDLAPHLLHDEPLEDRTLFWRMDDEYAVRNGPWKLCFTNGQTELYRLDNDLGEAHDLADQQPELVAELTASWVEWEAQVNQSAEEHRP